MVYYFNLLYSLPFTMHHRFYIISSIFSIHRAIAVSNANNQVRPQHFGFFFHLFGGLTIEILYSAIVNKNHFKKAMFSVSRWWVVGCKGSN